MANWLKQSLRRHWKGLAVGYLLLLAASHLFVFWQGEDEEVGGELEVQLPQGVLVYHEWGERVGVPLILSHGSPGGGGGDFEKFAEALAEKRWVIAPDRWGFGKSEKRVADYSFVADARAMVGLMDHLEIAEADVMGWSYGGGVVLEMADRFPDRVRSVGLLGALGIQEGEGTGSYAVEHAKYGLLWGVAVALPEMIPHFGLAGPRWFRRSFVRDFWDADQRPLRGILDGLPEPVLIVHGKDDPLVPAWVAEEHHELLARSRLEILEGSHFFPLGGQGLQRAVVVIDEFLEDVENGDDVAGVHSETSRKKMRAVWTGGPELRGYKPWWLVVAFSGLGAWFKPRLTMLLVALGGGLLLWDLMLGVVSVLVVVLGKKWLAKEGVEKKGKWFPLLLLVNLMAGSVVGGLFLRI